MNMIYKSSRGKTIEFDDYVDNIEEYDSYWVGMCPCCHNKYKGILGQRASSGGSGACSVLGCENEAEYYVDFNKNEVSFIGVEMGELKQKIDKQRSLNVMLYKSIPLASHEDPTNKKSELILKQWREGSAKLKQMLVKLQELELKDKKIETKDNVETFINGFGEATKRNITCLTYKRTVKRNEKLMLSFVGGR